MDFSVQLTQSVAGSATFCIDATYGSDHSILWNNHLLYRLQDDEITNKSLTALLMERQFMYGVNSVITSYMQMSVLRSLVCFRERNTYQNCQKINYGYKVT